MFWEKAQIMWILYIKYYYTEVKLCVIAITCKFPAPTTRDNHKQNRNTYIIPVYSNENDNLEKGRELGKTITHLHMHGMTLT